MSRAPRCSGVLIPVALLTPLGLVHAPTGSIEVRRPFAIRPSAKLPLP
jgi:hypothetical protein